MKMHTKRAPGTIGRVATKTFPHMSFMVSKLNQLTTFDEAALNLSEA